MRSAHQDHRIVSIYVCQKASWQINALKRISKFLNERCRMHVHKSFVSANFNCCPVVWMFCGKTNLGKLERLQERALSIIFSEKSHSYNELLKKSGQLSVEFNLMRFLIIEVFNVLEASIRAIWTICLLPLHRITTFEIRPGCCNRNSTLTLLDINLSDTLAPKFGIFSQRSWKRITIYMCSERNYVTGASQTKLLKSWKR